MLPLSTVALKSVQALFKGGLPETVEIQNCWGVIFFLFQPAWRLNVRSDAVKTPIDCEEIS